MRELHEKLRNVIEIAPTLKMLIAEDVYISIADLEQVVFQIESKELKLGGNVGYKITEQDPMYKVIKENKPIRYDIPKELYGEAIRLLAAPITDNKGEVVGVIGVNYSLDTQYNLIQVAEQFAASSEEIAASTQEMATSANELVTNMSTITIVQKEINSQVDQSERILELINSVAKSSRILGLNAGIEAARSGEHGRGFSIVAKEITKLADSIATSVNEIRELLNSVREKVNHSSDIVHYTDKISKHQSTAINEISQAIQHLTDAAEDVEELAKKI